MVVIDASEAFSRYVESGKGADFVALMLALHDQPHYGGYRHLMDDALPGAAAPDDERGSDPDSAGLPTPRRYRVATLQRLERILATRSIDTRTLRLQLCHFVAALSGGDRSWLDVHQVDLPVAGPAHPAVFARHFEGNAAANGSIVLASGGIEIGGAFTLAFARMPILDAFLGFLLTSEIEGEVTALFDRLTAAPIDEGSIKRAAAALGSLVEPYLDRIVRRRDDLKSFRSIVDGLRRVAADPDGPLQFDDAHLLAFWRIAASGERFSGDWVRFETTASRVVLTAWALRCGAALIALRQEMKPIGGDLEAGEVDVSETDGLASLMEDAGSPLDPFRQGAQLAELKLINKRECERLAFLLDHGRALTSFAKTFLRREVFGPVQNKLSNVKRVGARRDDQERQLLEMAEIADDAYRRVRDELSAERQRLLDKLLGILAVARHYEPETFADYDHLAQWFDDDDLQTLDRRGQEALRAFSAMRRGTVQSALSTPAVADLLIGAIDPLVTVVARLNAMIDELERCFGRDAPERLLDADKSQFAAIFAALYSAAGQGQPA